MSMRAKAIIPIDSRLIFPVDGSVLVYGREQLLLEPGLKVSIPEPRVSMPEQSLSRA